MKTIIPILFAFFWCNFTLNAQINLLKDINTSYDVNCGSLPTFGVELNGFAYFSANTGMMGQLMKSNGTKEGTFLVKELNLDNITFNPIFLTVFNSRIYYVVSDNQNQYELWVTDGTSNGTSLVLKNVTIIHGVVQNKLLFTHNDKVHGYELWTIDAANQIQLLKDLAPGINDFRCGKFKVIQGKGYFINQINLSGLGIYQTDGTAQGTFQIETSLVVDNTDSPFYEFNDEIYFTTTEDLGYKKQLWKSNGQPNSAVMLKEFNWKIMGEFTNDSNFLYFSASDSTSGGLWKTDGTSNGTSLLKDFFSTQPNYPFPTDLICLNNEVYFNLDRTFWKSQGTPISTIKLKEINFLKPKVYANHLLFSSADTNNLMTFWKSDGSQAGTTQILNVFPYFDIKNSLILNTNLILSLYDSAYNYELWKIDSTFSPILIKDLNKCQMQANPNQLTVFNDQIIFSADDGVNGREIWLSKGANQQTTMLKDIRSGSKSSYPKDFKVLNSLLFFAADDGVHGEELWKTDGTAIGTELLLDLNPDTLNASPSNFNIVNNYLVFSIEKQGNYELWSTDGSLANTQKIADLDYDQSYYAFNNELYFSGYDPVHGRELWKTDGTVGGTQLVKDFDPLIGNGSILRHYFIYQNELYFTCTSQGNIQKWKTNGTTNGTVLADYSIDFYKTMTIDSLLFSINSNKELWRTNLNGSQSFKVVPQDTNLLISNVKSLIYFNNEFYFIAYDSINNYGIWKTNGLTKQATIVKSIYFDKDLNNNDNYLEFLKVINGYLYFSAQSKHYGIELWRTDGTSCNTYRMTDLNIGEFSSLPQNLVSFDDHIYFTATASQEGNEIWYFKDTLTDQPFSVIDNSLNNNYFTTQIEADAYTWINCETNEIVQSGAMNFYYPTLNGKFKVQVNHNGCIKNSECIEFLGNISEFENFIFPNPTNSMLTVKLNSNEGNIKIANSQGMVLLNQTIYDHQALNVAFLANGIYYLYIETNLGTELKTFVKF